MKTPLDNNLNKVYDAFNQNHNHLRQTLMASLPDSMKQQKQAGRISHVMAFTRGTIMRSRITKLGMAAAIIIGVPGLLVFFFGNGETISFRCQE